MEAAQLDSSSSLDAQDMLTDAATAKIQADLEKVTREIEEMKLCMDPEDILTAEQSPVSPALVPLLLHTDTSIGAWQSVPPQEKHRHEHCNRLLHFK